MRYTFSSFILDTDYLELRLEDDTPVDLEPQAFRLLAYLVENRNQVVGKEELIEHVWQGRVVSDAALTTRVNAARRAVGDSGKDQRIIRTVPRRGYRFVADVETHGVAGDDSDETQAKAKHGAGQVVRFCTAADNTRIAYASVGTGPVLVKAANWLNHLEFDWDSPVWRHLLRGLAEDWRLVRYDARGTGLSDWEVDDISFDAYVRDLEAIADAIGVERFPILGISQGCAVAIAYAARHPGRVARLVLYGGYARGAEHREDTAEVERSRALRTLLKDGWGQENPAFRQIFTSLFMPGATTEQVSWFNDLQRISTSPGNALRFREVLDRIDVTDLLSEIAVPTLVLHCREDAMVPFEEGRRMAAAIPGAEFVPLEGKNHLILETDSAWPRFTAEIEAFLKSGL